MTIRRPSVAKSSASPAPATSRAPDGVRPRKDVKFGLGVGVVHQRHQHGRYAVVTDGNEHRHNLAGRQLQHLSELQLYPVAGYRHRHQRHRSAGGAGFGGRRRFQQRFAGERRTGRRHCGVAWWGERRRRGVAHPGSRGRRTRPGWFALQPGRQRARAQSHPGAAIPAAASTKRCANDVVSVSSGDARTNGAATSSRSRSPAVARRPRPPRRQPKSMAASQSSPALDNGAAATNAVAREIVSPDDVIRVIKSGDIAIKHTDGASRRPQRPWPAARSGCSMRPRAASCRRAPSS